MNVQDTSSAAGALTVTAGALLIQFALRVLGAIAAYPVPETHHRFHRSA